MRGRKGREGMTTGIRRWELPIEGELSGVKVDTLLRRTMGLSGTLIRRIKWLEDGILVDGQRVDVRYVPKAGQVLSVRLSDPERRSGVVAAPGELDIVYEDGDVVVVNKAPGVAVHPGPGHYDDTISNFLLDHYEKEGMEGDIHPVHRLDRGTSGLMVVARHPHAQEVLKQALHGPGFRRSYLAVCCGVPQPRSGTIRAPIGRAEGALLAREVRPDGQSASTRYTVLRSGNGRSLVALELETGRTHQIRVHMAHMGHPLVGDFLYGREETAIARPALHAHQLSFRHPMTGAALDLIQPLPPDMEALTAQMR